MKKYIAILIVVLVGLDCQALGESSGSDKSSGPPTSSGSADNRVLSLDGQMSYMQVADSESLHSFTNAITIEAWFKASSFYTGDFKVNSIIRKNVSAGAENFFLRFRTVRGKRLVEMSPGGQIGVVRTPHEFTTGKWYHLAETYDGSAIAVFVNGVRIDSQNVSGAMAIDKSDLFIGKGDPEYSFGEYFHGALDEVRLWNVARSQEDIQATMKAALTGKEQGLVAYWSFNDGTAKDLSGHGHDGRLGGGAQIVELARAEKAPTAAKRTREKARDGIVHIEEGVVLEIPDVPPLCDKMDVVKRRINVGDCELYCEIEGDGTPLVLINGGPGGTHHAFHPAFSRAKDFAKVIYYDQRGCGLSDYEPGEGYSVEQAVNDLEKLRKALGVEKWVVLGHSYGGILAQTYCVTYPDSMAGLILLASSEAMPVKLKPTRQYLFITQKEQAKMRSIREEIGRLKQAGENVGEEHVLFNNWLNGDWKRQSYYKPSREEIARIARYEWKHDKAFRQAVLSDSGAVDLKGAFGIPPGGDPEDCPIPTLILEGKWDLTWDTDKAGVLHRNHPSARLVIFEESGHSPFEDEPEAFFDTLKDFIINLPQVPGEKLEPWKRYLVKRPQKRMDPLLTSEINPEEAKAIEQFRRVRAGILAGETYQSAASPLDAILTFLSAKHRDRGDYFMSLDILRAPLPPAEPEEGTLWPVFMTYPGRKKLADTFVLGYSEGRWIWIGNMGRAGDWRMARTGFQKWLQKAVEKQSQSRR